MLKKVATVDSYDDHLIHIDEHTRRVLEYDVENESDAPFKQRLTEHINEHKKYIMQVDLNNLKEGI